MPPIRKRPTFLHETKLRTQKREDTRDPRKSPLSSHIMRHIVASWNFVGRLTQWHVRCLRYRESAKRSVTMIPLDVLAL